MHIQEDIITATLQDEAGLAQDLLLALSDYDLTKLQDAAELVTQMCERELVLRLTFMVLQVMDPR